MRSTPTPKDCLRTVKVSRAPWPWRLMTTPSKTWTRLRAPSMTWKWTLTRSPGEKFGTRRSCARSMVAMTLLMRKGPHDDSAPSTKWGTRTVRTAMVADVPSRPRRRPRSAGGPAVPERRRALAALLAPPALDLRVMAREQHLRHLPAPELGRARVVRVLRVALQSRAEGLLGRRALIAQGAGKLAHDGVADDHRGRLAAAEDIAADRDDVGGEVLDDPLVEALVAAAQERQLGLAGQLVDERVVE